MNPKLQLILQDLLKRLHANLTCIGELSEKHNQQNLTKVVFPQILTAPADVLELNEFYAQLQKLFPEGMTILQRRALQLRQEQMRSAGENQGQMLQGQPHGQGRQLQGQMQAQMQNQLQGQMGGQLQGQIPGQQQQQASIQGQQYW